MVGILLFIQTLGLITLTINSYDDFLFFFISALKGLFITITVISAILFIVAICLIIGAVYVSIYIYLSTLEWFTGFLTTFSVSSSHGH